MHEGKGLARLSSQERVITAGALIYIPPNTRVSLKNTGSRTLSLFFIFPKPEMVSGYYRELTVKVCIEVSYSGYVYNHCHLSTARLFNQWPK